MKATGRCPKCSERDVLVVDVTDQIESADVVGLSQDAYVCGACGYVEFYARDVDAVRRVARSVATRSPFRSP
jgi:predicted nucleic-acid-binding Zn-ribbon protein